MLFFVKKKNENEKKKIVFLFVFTNNVFFCYTYHLFLKNQPLTSAPDDYIVYNGTIFCFVYSVHVIYKFRTCLRALSCNFVVDG